MAKNSKYQDLGVDAGKDSVRKAFAGVIDNDYPGAFVNIINDPEIDGLVHTLHQDGDGSKILARLVLYNETGNVAYLRGAVDDALQMNLGDISASGFVFGLTMVGDVIDIRNTPNVPKDIIMEQIAIRISELMALYKSYGFDQMYFMGGETADLPDQIRNIAFNVGVYARAKKGDIVTGNVAHGDKIWGFASDGQAVWEGNPNSGIMANGLTLGRNCLTWSGYNDTYPALIGKNKYYGRYHVGDTHDFLPETTVLEALVSPTRQWSILIRILMEKLKENDLLHMLHGISMNTGGGATKIGHVGNSILYKKTMPTLPGIFQLIQQEGEVSWKEMFEDFNCGIGIDVVGEDNLLFAQVLEEVSAETQVQLYELGTCEKWDGDGNKVVLETPYGKFDDY